MPTLRCKKCGGDLNIIDTETSLCECEYCGSKETLPTVNDEKIMKLYDRANRLRLSNEFDKAASVYESIIAESDTEAEAYWGLVLCKYGIEYVDDPATGNKIPTCHRLSFESVMEDSDLEMVMENADTLSRTVYRENAKQIEDIRRGIIEVSEKEAPYDIFICYKETDENGDRTIDSVLAQNTYDALCDKGYRVFFSRITLEDKLGQEYEPYIFAALNSAKIMLAFGTNYDYYNAVWVKNEWSRYLKLMTKDKEKHLIPCYKGIDAYDIPKEFKHLQAQDMGKVGADQDLLRGIDKILRPTQNTANSGNVNHADLQATIANAVSVNSGNNINALIERGFMTLEDGDFEKADNLFEEVLNQNPKCAEAYMGKLMAYYKVKNIEDFINLIFEKVICKSEEVEIKPDYDVTDVIKAKYFLSNQLSDDLVNATRESLCATYKTNIASLQVYDPTKDYVEIFCGLDNDSLYNGSILDDRYYARFKQFATEELKTKFNVNALLTELVSTKLQEENIRIEAINRRYSKEGLEELLEQANTQVKSILGDEYDQIESKYQEELKTWEDVEKGKRDAYEKKCQNIKENWPILRVEIQNNWKTECERLNREYEAETLRVNKHNEDVINAFKLAKSEYDKQIAELDKQIRDKNIELSKINSIFKSKQKEELYNHILSLQSQKQNMKKPEMEDFGEILQSPQKISLPNQPEDSEEPIYPENTVQAERPVRVVTSKKIDGEDILANILSNTIEKFNILYPKTITFGVGPNQEPLDWILLKINKNDALLITKNVIDVIKYNDKFESTTWENCTLRAYLNDQFINNTFTSGQQAKIKRVILTNNDNDEYGTSGGNDTSDKVFCLSIDELDEYFTDEKDRIAIPTEYAKGKVSKDVMKYFLDESSGGGLWWLRSVGSHNTRAAYVEGSGRVEFAHSLVNQHFVGIRPALWLNLEP